MVRYQPWVHRRMRRTMVIIALAVFAFVAMMGTADAYRFSDQFEISTKIDSFTSLAFGTPNPNNSPLTTKKPDFMLLRNRAEIEIFFQPHRDARFFFKPRIQGNFTEIVNRNSPDYDAFPREFAGNGSLLRAGGDNFQAELREVWGAFNIGENFWLRLGKQQIVWGETIAVRVLDIVNPLDLSQAIFFNRAFDEFQEIRIPVWAARGIFSILNDTIPDLAIEGFINPIFEPTILPDQGAPWNPVPTFIDLTEDVNKNAVTFGGRISGTVGDSLALQIAFVSKPVQDAIGKGDPGPGGIRPDPVLGIPVLANAPFLPPFLAPFRFAPFRVVLEGKHPRVEIIGAGGSIQIDSLNAVFKLESTVTFDQPYAVGQQAFTIDERDVFKAVFSVDRPVHLLKRKPAMEVAFQFFVQRVLGDTTGLTLAGAPVDKAFEIANLLLRQPLMQKRLVPELLILYDLDNSYWVQQNIHFEHGDHWRFDLMGNFFGGDEKRPTRAGFFHFADNVALRVTYGF